MHDRLGMNARPIPAAEAIERDVADQLGLSPLRARELVRTVVAVLPRHLPTDVVERLAAHFPDTLSDLLSNPDLVEGAGPAKPSELEVASASPTGRPAHAHSVVEEDHPHDKTKISSARGGTDVRGETISRGRPTSSRPLHSARTEDHV